MGLNISSLDSKTIAFTLTNLAPDEVITETVLLRGNKPSEPIISFRSRGSIGKLGLITDQGTQKNSIWSIIIVAIAVIVGVVLNLFSSRYIFRYVRRRFNGIFISRNDMAFALIQEKMLDQAHNLLTLSLNEKGGGPFELANLGLVEGLKGNSDFAEKYLKLAAWWAEGGHALAVVEYNRAVIKVNNGDDAGALIDLKKAINISGSEIKRYCSINAYIQEAAQRNAGIKEAIKPVRSLFS